MQPGEQHTHTRHQHARHPKRLWHAGGHTGSCKDLIIFSAELYAGVRGLAGFEKQKQRIELSKNGPCGETARWSFWKHRWCRRL